jgi:hypothetical protein
MSAGVRLIGFAVAALSIASAIAAQTVQPRGTRGSVSGLVIDAATLAPLENSTVALSAATGLGAFPPGRDGSVVLPGELRVVNSAASVADYLVTIPAPISTVRVIVGEQSPRVVRLVSTAREVVELALMAPPLFTAFA